MTEVTPDFEAWLTAAGALKDGEPDRTWFEEQCALSARANAFAHEEMDRELEHIVREGYGDSDEH